VDEIDDFAEGGDHLRDSDDHRPGIGQVHEEARQPAVAPPDRSDGAALCHVVDMGAGSRNRSWYRVVND
jgi:hypothetical protein